MTRPQASNPHPNPSATSGAHFLVPLVALGVAGVSLGAIFGPPVIIPWTGAPAVADKPGQAPALSLPQVTGS